VDDQEFSDIEAYGVQRWLGELALALRRGTYRPDPIRRVFIPKAVHLVPRPFGSAFRAALRGAGLVHLGSGVVALQLSLAGRGA
jgi:glycine/D-amino acid oxidase-like deaminating enzyme